MSELTEPLVEFVATLTRDGDDNMIASRFDFFEGGFKAGKKIGYEILRAKIEEIIAEFGDDPKACCGIIGEWLDGAKEQQF